MKLETAKILVEASKELNLKFDLREHYSGRGMYGRETTAIVLENFTDMFGAVAIATKNVLEEDQKNGTDGFVDFAEDLGFRSDSMGKGWVIY